jgi:hypothetical protein
MLTWKQALRITYFEKSEFYGAFGYLCAIKCLWHHWSLSDAFGCLFAPILSLLHHWCKFGCLGALG